ISDQDGLHLPFNISSNDGESSSLLPFGLHSELYRDIVYEKSIPVITKRLDTLLNDDLSIDVSDYNFLNIDLQGMELPALKSLGTLLWRIRYAYVEINKAEVYSGCALLPELDSHLAKFGFVRKQVAWAVDDIWGDAFYMR
ncbi:MAG TPA: FkbM family methyltransferase, partial [Puia sp.]|nr:FkbM family methyltransferase [Puia sp.]